MAPMMEHALAYLARGMSVIPAQGKKPVIEWAAYQDRRPTAEEVRKWWTQYPNANIAMITGKVSGLVVIDVDVKKGAKPAEVFSRFPSGLVSRTGSGGGHLFYAYPEDVDRVANRVGKDGIDIRGDGGYVILPPSTHVSGKRYVWLNEGTPAVCPDFVWAEQAADKGAPEEGWLAKLLAGGMKDGDGRNDAATRLAGYFAGKGMAQEVAGIMLAQWNDRNDPPLPERELMTTLASVYRKAAKRTHNDPKSPVNTGPKELTLIPFRQYMAKYGDSSVKWAIEEWLPQDTVAFVVSAPGSYKTWTVLDLAVSIASGRPFLGKFPVLQQPRPVLIMQQEDFHGQLAERMGMAVAAKYGFLDLPPTGEDQFDVPVIPDLPIHMHPDRAFRFDDQAMVDALERRIAQIRPGLVILDPLYSAGNTDDYMAKTTEQMFVFKKWRDKYGCSFLVVHHTKKSTEGVSMREMAWGSQFLNAFLETGWQIRRMPEEGETAVAVHRHFKVKGTMTPMLLNWDVRTDFPFKYEVKSETLDEEKLEERSNIVGYIEKNGPATISKIAEEMKVNRSTVSRKVSALVKSGALTKTEDGRIAIPKGPEL